MNILSLKVTLVMTKRPAADSELIIAYVMINLAFSNHHDFPKIKSIDIKQFNITMLV